MEKKILCVNSEKYMTRMNVWAFDNILVTISEDNGEIMKSKLNKEQASELYEGLGKWLKEEKLYDQVNMEVLIKFYQTNPQACAKYCDEVLDCSGKLLDKVREKVNED